MFFLNTIYARNGSFHLPQRTDQIKSIYYTGVSEWFVGVSMLVVLPILGNPEVLQYQANHQQPNALREALFCMNVIL